jgi:hypothetical protein
MTLKPGCIWLGRVFGKVNIFHRKITKAPEMLKKKMERR